MVCFGFVFGTGVSSGFASFDSRETLVYELVPIAPDYLVMHGNQPGRLGLSLNMRPFLIRVIYFVAAQSIVWCFIIVAI
jgi:hypothetical protein